MPGEGADGLTGGRIPEPDHRVPAGGGEPGAVGMERNGIHVLFVGGECADELAGGCVPELGRAVRACRGKAPAVGTVRRRSRRTTCGPPGFGPGSGRAGRDKTTRSHGGRSCRPAGEFPRVGVRPRLRSHLASHALPGSVSPRRPGAGRSPHSSRPRLRFSWPCSSFCLRRAQGDLQLRGRRRPRPIAR